MNERPKNFEETAEEAEQQLELASGMMKGVMEEVSVDEIERMKRSLVENTAEEFLDIVSKNIEDWKSKSWDSLIPSMKSSFLFISSHTPPGFCGEIAHEVVASDKWKKYRGMSDPDSHIAMFVFLSLLGERYGSEEKAVKEEARDTSPIPMLLLRFDNNDFSGLPEYFGSLLPEYISMTIAGDVGTCVGEHMNGGILTVEGDADTIAGFCMHGGTLIIQGTVIGFDESAFDPDVNHGTIIWRDVTIWNDGWTAAGKDMFEKDEIPIDK